MNINSIRNRFELLCDQIKGAINILRISETKTDDSFSIKNFSIDEFSTAFLSDHNANGAGIMLHVSEDIRENIFFLLKMHH